ncbi:Glyoxalase/Bleomycin resistance protein/Dihydroxybiphenyl dioxygenase [Xylariales sp. PMI_506]|nr:Glyoxalase/Bleomycin resistance protein/Dihydroxybiphenyl dioxygenase [Xylariales sp. PMI_506]
MEFIISTLGKLPESVRRFIIPDMLLPTVKNSPDKVQLDRIAHVYFEHPDLEKFAEFSKDWGFVETKRTDDRIYLRGYGKDPYAYVASKSKDGKPRFGGAAFVAASEAEFEKARKLPDAIESSLEDAPGGGKMITFVRPDRTKMHIVYGQVEREVSDVPPSATHEVQGPYNGPFEKPRRGTFQRYREGPALIHKLGHYGYVSCDFDKEFEWYTSNFNFVPSNVLHHWDLTNVDVLTFMHLDRGKKWSDHHTLFLQRAPPTVKKTFLHHTSYEVADFDEQLLGHAWLAKKGYKSVWGVGRHVLGSQIFDYWKDISGFNVEHYADGDLVNEDTPTEREVVGPISVWGPEMPKDFVDAPPIP